MLNELLIRRSWVRVPAGSYRGIPPQSARTQATGYGTLYGTPAVQPLPIYSSNGLSYCDRRPLDPAIRIALVGLWYALAMLAVLPLSFAFMAVLR